MSIRAVNWALYQRTSADAKVLLLVLAVLADDTNTVYVDDGALAILTGLPADELLGAGESLLLDGLRRGTANGAYLLAVPPAEPAPTSRGW